MNTNKITINGKTTIVSGNNISIINGKVTVDGVSVDTGGVLSGEVIVKFEGDLASLKCDGRAEVSGNVHGKVEANGSIQCGDVEGNVKANGSVKCGTVSGDVQAMGSVKIYK